MIPGFPGSCPTEMLTNLNAELKYGGMGAIVKAKKKETKNGNCLSLSAQGDAGGDESEDRHELLYRHSCRPTATVSALSSPPFSCLSPPLLSLVSLLLSSPCLASLSSLPLLRLPLTCGHERLPRPSSRPGAASMPGRDGERQTCQ
eukprot:749636-Hanusia_phi.AAC.1